MAAYFVATSEYINAILLKCKNFRRRNRVDECLYWVTGSLVLPDPIICTGTYRLEIINTVKRSTALILCVEGLAMRD